MTRTILLSLLLTSIVLLIICISLPSNSEPLGISEFDMTVEPPEEFTNSIGMKFKLIPAGEFMMGAVKNKGEYSYGTDVTPHRVRITQPYYLSIHEVTHSQWRKVMGTQLGESWADLSDEILNRPVDYVTWYDAVDFCIRLSKLEGKSPYYRITDVVRFQSLQLRKLGILEAKVEIIGGEGYRLPTEAQWEYACRAGSTTTYCFGDDPSSLPFYARFNTKDGALEVGQKRPNAWNLYDMHGNVSEWCEDWFGDAYYLESPTNDPTGPISGSGFHANLWGRIVRGGNSTSQAIACRSASREDKPPHKGHRTIGFRVALYHPNHAYKVDVQPGKQPESEPIPEISVPKDVVIEEYTNSIGMKLHLLPAGEFVMGSPYNEQWRDDDEDPLHKVRITKPFYMGVRKVTQSQWKSVMHIETWDKYDFSNDPHYPATSVNWQEAVDFCEKLSKMEGRTYRLPTEAEWEYACRAGTTTPYSFGKSPLKIDQHMPLNPWGLYHMHGGGSEWCHDWYDEYYYKQSPVNDPKGPEKGLSRVLRSDGSSNPRQPWSYARSADRYRDSPRFGFCFRVVMEIENKSDEIKESPPSEIE